MAADKDALRGLLRDRRAAVSVGDHAAWSERLCEAVRRSRVYAEVRAIAAFVGVRGEPDTRLIIQDALASSKILWLPRVISKEALDFVNVTSMDQLVAGRFGLFEPSSDLPGRGLHETAVDLVLVPGLGFGRDGARIGQGRGYYDRALAGFGDARPTCMGMCFSAFLDPVEGPIPMSALDQRVDLVATDEGLDQVANDASTTSTTS